MSMCNNDVTYHDKWDTMDNNAALKKLDQKYFDRSICSPSCPVSWAPEVLELLERLDQEFGIARNTETIRAYRITSSMTELFFKKPIKNAYWCLKTKTSYKGKQYSLKERIERAYEELKRTLDYARKAFLVVHINSHINKILKPKITLSQVKEKYGYLTLYIDCPPEYKEYVNNLIYETTLKLAKKGAYYPLKQIVNKDE